MVTPKPMDAGSVTTRQEKTYGGISDHPDCLSNDRCNPEQMRGTLTLQGGEEVSIMLMLNAFVKITFFIFTMFSA